MIEIIPTNVRPHMREVMAVPLDTFPPAARVSFKAYRRTKREKGHKFIIECEAENEESAAAYDSVEEDGLVKCGNKRIDGILVVSVVEFVAGDAFHLVAEIAVLVRVGHSGRHRHQCLLQFQQF